LHRRILGLVIVGLAWAVPALATPTRIAWDEESSPVRTWVRPAPPGSDADQEIQRVAALHGRLLAFERADTSLYAVFLDSPSRMPQLRRILQSVGGPARWRETERPELTSFLDHGASFEWLPLKKSGALTVVADDNRQPGKTYLVVINGSGEILGSRPLWDAPDLAQAASSRSRTQILSDRSVPGGTD
jgi:hypothetical protein